MTTKTGRADYIIDHPRPARFFTWHEVRCHHCYRLPPVSVMSSENFKTMAIVADTIRLALARPLIASSWWRCENHPVEAAKDEPGAHYFGLAIDFLMSGGEPIKAMSAVMGLNKSRVHPPNLPARYGFGLMQHGPVAGRYMHVDVAGNVARWRGIRPWVWTYP